MAVGLDALTAGVGQTDQRDARHAVGGLLAVGGPTVLDIRTGVLAGPGSTALLVGTADTGQMTVAINPHVLVGSRGVANGAYLGPTLDAQTKVNIDPAPGTGSRIDIVYARQRDTTSGVPSPDVTPGPEYGVLKGDSTTGTPAKKDLSTIAGAVELGTVQVSAGATSTSGSGVTITQTVPQTVARGAAIPVRSQAERDALNASAFPGLHVKRLDLGGVLERWVSGTTWARYGSDWLPRSRRVPVTAAGSLVGSVKICADQALPAAPFGPGVPYRIQVSAQIEANVPSGLGVTLSATCGGTTYELSNQSNAGTTSAKYTVSGEEVFYIASDAAQTVSASVTSPTGVITIIATGKLVIEAEPYVAL